MSADAVIDIDSFIDVLQDTILKLQDVQKKGYKTVQVDCTAYIYLEDITIGKLKTAKELKFNDENPETAYLSELVFTKDESNIDGSDE